MSCTVLLAPMRGLRIRATKTSPLTIASTLMAVLAVGLLRGQTPATHAKDPVQALQQIPLAPTVDGGVKLTVLDANAQPCPKAIVVLAPPAVPQLLLTKAVDHRLADDPIRMLAASVPPGSHRIALDEHGATRIPTTYHGTMFAFGDDSAATVVREVDAPRTSQTVRLLRVEWASAKATLHDGKPAPGVAIAVDDPRNAFARATVITGPDGTARIPILPLRPDTPPIYRLRAMLPLKNVLAQPAGTAEAPAQFVLPKCSSLRVRWTGLPKGVVPRIALQTPLPANRLGITAPLLSLSSVDRTLGYPQASDADSAYFAYVEAGLPLEAAVTLDGVVGTLLFPAPTVAEDQDAECAIDFAAGPPRLRLRILDAADKPVADAQLLATFTGGVNRGRYELHSDAEGYVRLAPLWDPATDTSLRLVRQQSGVQSEVLGAASVPLGAVKPGDNDLGSVRLQPDPVAFAGRMLDANATPVVGVRIAVLHRSAQDDSTLSGSDGAFEVRIPEPLAPTMRISLPRERNCYFADAPGQPNIEVPSGRKDAVLTLERAGRLLIGLSPPIQDPLRGLSLVGTELDHTEVTFTKDVPSNTKMLDVPAGRWKLELQHFGQRVTTLDEVTVDPGVENHDARLMAIDWRAFAHLVTLRFEAPDGSPCSECSVLAYPQKAPAGAAGILGGAGKLGAIGIPVAGKVTLLLPKASNYVTVRPRDTAWRMVELVDVNSDRVIRFAPAIRLDLSWNEPLRLPPKTQLVAMVMAGTARRILVFDAADKAALYAESEGTVSLHLGFRTNGKTTYLDDVMEVTGADQPGTRVLQVPPTLRAAIDALPK